AEVCRGKSIVLGRRTGPALDIPPDLALFRGIRFTGGPCTPSRQFSGSAQTGHRSPNIAYEYWTLSSLHGLRTGLRMARHTGNRRAPGSHAGDLKSDGIVPWTFVQLVRHM